MRAPRGTAAPVLLTLVFCWLVALMLAVLIVGSAAIGIYEALLIVELIALAIVIGTVVALRRAPDPDAAERRIERRQRERRGF